LYLNFCPSDFTTLDITFSKLQSGFERASTGPKFFEAETWKVLWKHNKRMKELVLHLKCLYNHGDVAIVHLPSIVAETACHFSKHVNLRKQKFRFSVEKGPHNSG